MPKNPPKMGRPTKELDHAQVERLILDGKSDKEIADFFKISRSTFALWCKKNNFSDTKKRLKEKADDPVEVSLRKRAEGFVGPDGRYYPPDPTCCIFWLKNRHPDRWRDRIDMDHSVKINVRRVTFNEAG